MENVKVDFEKRSHTLDEIMNGKCLPGFQDIGCIMIFDININEIFNGKARLVSGGHTTELPTSTTYSSFISRDSVRVVFMLAAINDIDVYAANIGNAYLNVTCWEYIWTIAGPEFGNDEGSKMIIIRELCKLKISGASWRSMLSNTLGIYGLGYTSSKFKKYVRIKI